MNQPWSYMYYKVISLQLIKKRKKKKWGLEEWRARGLWTQALWSEGVGRATCCEAKDVRKAEASVEGFVGTRAQQPPQDDATLIEESQSGLKDLYGLLPGLVKFCIPTWPWNLPSFLLRDQLPAPQRFSSHCPVPERKRMRSRGAAATIPGLAYCPSAYSTK